MKHHLLCCFSCLATGATLVSGCSRSWPIATDTDSYRAHPLRSGVVDAARHSQSVNTDEDVSMPVLDASATLNDYLRYAALSNPGLESAFQQWQAALEQVPQVGVLPDPRVTYGYYLGEVETRVGPMQQSIAVFQTFPWAGKLQDKEDAASRNAMATFGRFESARLALGYRVERAYNELFYLKHAIDIARENIELLGQFERVVRARYRVAAAGHPDVVRIQVELGTIEDRLRQLEDLRLPYEARLNAMLNRSSAEPLPWIVVLADRVTDRDFAELEGVLRAHNPELLALQEEIERERINTEIARKNGLPDVTLGLAYTQIGERNGVVVPENGDDAVLASVSLNIPLWRSKYDAGVRQSIARRLALVGRRQEQANVMVADLQEAVFEHHDARRRIELYRDTLIPKSNELLQASLTGFEQGTSDFLDLVDTQRTLLEFQLSLVRAQVDRATSYARMENLIGVQISEIGNDADPQEDTP